MTKNKNNNKSTVSCVSLCEQQLIDTLSSVKIEKSDWLNSNEAAEFLKISVMTLRNMASNGRIPYYKLGRSNRYSQKELENFLLKNKRGNIYGN